MSFFDSEIVRAEMAEVSELQEEVYSNVMKFHQMNDEDKYYHIKLLDKLKNNMAIKFANSDHNVKYLNCFPKPTSIKF